MQRDRFAKVELRPNKAAKIEITPELIHPDYELLYQNSSFSTNTGLLELFHLRSSKSSFPNFVARWDLRPNTVDVDMDGNSAEQRKFKAGKGGYTGHHSTLLSESPRVHRVEIKIPQADVFRATIVFEGEGIVNSVDEVGEVIMNIQDELRIMVACPLCGPVAVSGPPFVLSECPQCKSSLRSDRELNQ